MIDETKLWIGLFFAAMVFITVIGILMVCIRWFVVKKQEGSLKKQLLPPCLYGVYPFISNPLLNIENPETFLPYIEVV